MPDRHRLESFGQQLTIDNVQLSDAGTYECEGINNMTMTPVKRLLHLTVECKYRYHHDAKHAYYYYYYYY